MKVIGKQPEEPAQLIEIENTLESLQKYVGGYIETVTIAEDACIVCNEEGRMLGLKRNCTLFGHEFVGPILLVGVKGDEFCDTPETFLELMKK